MNGRNQFLVICAGLIAFLLGQTFSPEPGRADESKQKDRAWLGVSVQEVPSKYRHKYDLKRDNGVLVSFVADDSPADQADLELGDIILAVDGTAVKSPVHFSRLIKKI